MHKELSYSYAVISFVGFLGACVAYNAVCDAREKEQPLKAPYVQPVYSQADLEGLDRIVEQTGDSEQERIMAAIRTVESHGNCSAVSKKGAKGCFQTMKATEQRPGFGVKPMNGDADQKRFATDYYNKVMEHDARLLALASYNAGPGVVDKAVKEALAKLPRETQQYVVKVEKQYAMQ